MIYSTDFMKTENQSAKVRNYAIAMFFVMASLFAIAFFLKIAAWSLSDAPLNIRSSCNNNSANVFIGAGRDVRDITCVALDTEFFENPEITIGDLSKNDEDVCRFELSKPTDKPLRFEVRYDGKSEREVCNWQDFNFVD